MGSGPETHGHVAIPRILRGEFEGINYGAIRDLCRDYRDGTDQVPGSENWPVLAYGTALLLAWKAPDRIQQIDLTQQKVIDWWKRELRVRLNKGLQLTEARSRIYAVWGAPLICWLYRAFRAMGDNELTDLHRRYVRATAAYVALCAYRVRPVRLSPEGRDNAWPVPISVPLAGARSLELREWHHLLHSAYEMLAADLLDIDWSHAGGSQDRWAQDVIRMARNGWMGLTNREVLIFRAACDKHPNAASVVDDLMDWLDGVGTRWSCRLIRFDRGSACIGLERSVNGNTAPIFAYATHEDGTMSYLAVHGRSHGVDSEPCGVNELDHGEGRIKYVAWAGGEHWPKREMVLTPERYGRVLWDVHLHRDGNHVVRRPVPDEPPAPPNVPEPPDGSQDDRDWWDRIGEFFSRLWHSIEKRV